MTISFDVEGVVKAQPRPKACRRGNRAGVYDPGTAKSWKERVYSEAIKHRTPKPIETGIALTLIFRMPRPKGHYTTKGLRSEAPLSHEIRPDADNLAKAVCDALSDAEFWRDDCLVWHLAITKRYITETERPGCFITIETQ
jgi:Holliday junction resolvase RusA-like endonuclease